MFLRVTLSVLRSVRFKRSLPAKHRQHARPTQEAPLKCAQPWQASIEVVSRSSPQKNKSHLTHRQTSFESCSLTVFFRAAETQHVCGIAGRQHVCCHYRPRDIISFFEQFYVKFFVYFEQFSTYSKDTCYIHLDHIRHCLGDAFF